MELLTKQRIVAVYFQGPVPYHVLLPLRLNIHAVISLKAQNFQTEYGSNPAVPLDNR
jgi:hypothetical protein